MGKGLNEIRETINVRIIGGRLKGRKLIRPNGLAIRPTADRTREAIFNILGPTVIGAKVLDLFAGTGAFGIEAISRGAHAAVFVENDDNALSIIARNLQVFKLGEKSKVFKLDVLKNLDYISLDDTKFGIIFLDPPYGKGMVSVVLNAINDSIEVAQDTVVIVEHALTEPISTGNDTFQLYDQRRYGNSLVSFLSNML